ncbi:hypothetical protein OKW76_11460 [Sphingomonas sp. S1-29]|uniref:hypothetical protein n=1 Tax=Sphingomonas sp. S1-29 TaxID=2991074 RepID=UPI00223F291B|nr:hypothetical protein [Sphingomonas sp. S1-29]UZK68659.1 hypothetical protein OKW76_11460 [Sphingomonas sp. S1-29]
MGAKMNSLIGCGHRKGLQIMQDCLRLISEKVEGGKSIDRPHGRGNIKQYMHYDNVLTLALHAGEPISGKYHLIFHRIPPRRKLSEIIAGEHWPLSVRECNLARCATDGDSDRVLAIGEPSEAPNQIIAAGITIPSWVWVVPSDYIPNFPRDQIFTRVLMNESPLQARVGIVGPREVCVLDRLVDGSAAGEKTLVEGVFKIVESLSAFPSYDRRDRILQHDLNNYISGLRISLLDNGQVHAVAKISPATIGFINGFCRPIDELLRALEWV